MMLGLGKEMMGDKKTMQFEKVLCICGHHMHKNINFGKLLWVKTCMSLECEYSHERYAVAVDKGSE